MSAATAAPPSGALAKIDVLAPTVLFVSALVARVMEASLLSFPALDDPTFYLKVAENLAAGHGLAIDAIWSYTVQFPQVSHPSNEHWMPLASLALAPAFALFGASFRVAQVVGAVAGALLVLTTWHVARAALVPRGPWRGLTFFITAIIAFNPLLIYQSITADSAVYFGLLGTLALFLAATRASGDGVGPSRSLAYPAATGLLAGLAYLARTEGLVLLGVVLFWVWSHSPQEERWRRVAAVAAGAMAVAAPWLIRNTLALGSPFPSPALALALLPDYPALFHYGSPSYWDGLPPADLGQLAGLRLQGLAGNVRLLVIQAMFPLTPFALGGLGLVRSSPAIRLGLLFAMVLLVLSALLFPVLTLFGSFYHSVGAVLPFLAVAGALGLQRFGRLLGTRVFEDPDFMPVLVSIAVFVLVMVQLGLSATVASEQHKRWEQQFSIAAQWLDEHGGGAVMTTQPHSLHYASGLPAVMLPVGDPPEVAHQVALRYGARYAVGFGQFGRYPEALESGSAPGFKLVFSSDDVWIYQVQ